MTDAIPMIAAECPDGHRFNIIPELTNFYRDHGPIERQCPAVIPGDRQCPHVVRPTDAQVSEYNARLEDWRTRRYREMVR